MANQVAIMDHYDVIGPLHALRLRADNNGHPDYTCAGFFGNFSKSLAQSQADKHSWIFDGIGLGQNLQSKHVMDIGCGWGPILQAARARGGSGTGLTLSPGQVAHANARGLDVRLRDYKTVAASEFKVDGVISVGAFEHFCTPQEMLDGKQEEIYKDFFRICANMLPSGGGLFLQTMTWGKKVPDYSKLSLDADPDSTEAILARMERFYPDSWLPNGLDQLVDCSKDRFEFISSTNGRLDYIETLRQWNLATSNLWRPSLLPYSIPAVSKFAWRALRDKNTRILYESYKRSDQTTCFAREIMSHERMFFRKK
jgi:cyclopropane-fatty-acyl-phospholipid synthase